jgi:hypothetical protein
MQAQVRKSIHRLRNTSTFYLAILFNGHACWLLLRMLDGLLSFAAGAQRTCNTANTLAHRYRNTCYHSVTQRKLREHKHSAKLLLMRMRVSVCIGNAAVSVLVSMHFVPSFYDDISTVRFALPTMYIPLCNHRQL